MILNDTQHSMVCEQVERISSTSFGSLLCSPFSNISVSYLKHLSAVFVDISLTKASACEL